MKKWMSIIALITLILGSFPKIGLAAPTVAELEDYLSEIGWTKEELEEYLDFDDLTIEDFETIDELKEYLGSPITDENLNELLDRYDLTLEELENLLREYGELDEGEHIKDVFFFYEDLEATVSYYMENPLTPINEENLQQLLDEYGLTMEELEDLLQKNGDSLDNYEYIEDLDMAVDYYLNYAELVNEELAKYGITTEEIDNLINYLSTLNYEDPAFEEKMMELAERMESFGDFESAEDLTPEQIAEMADIMNDLLDLFQLKVKYYLVKGNERKAVSIDTLITMESPNGYDLAIELYDLQGNLLMDMILTAEMFGSELIKETGEDLKQVEKVVKTMPEIKSKTVKGAKLPKTASSYPANILLGLMIVLIGFILFRKWKGIYVG
jgi:processed acidic surface protein